MRPIEHVSGCDPILGPWEYARTRPHPSLVHAVRLYQGYSDRAPAQVRRREMPIADTVVIVNLGARWRLLSPDDGRLLSEHDSFAAGTYDTFAVVEGLGAAHCFHMDMTPYGAYRFFGLPMHHLAGVATDLEALLGPSVRRLQDQLHSAPTWAAAFDVLDRFIGERMQRARPVSRQVAFAMRALEASGGGVRVDSLSSELGWSRKHLRARFLEEVGVPAKRMAQVLRFNRALAGIHAAATDGGLAGLAAACGYADQAHLSREFRRFSGWSPREYLQQQTVAEGFVVT